ncbi:CHAD domain-containing protein [Paucibacter sp. TC2R-5]|uniref:CHAD domain-containing protein n=1 Tax=Paucibacter sp. TC2R-5 TaxID=2893555 RepID=UPI0021E36D60|nr:CHAD domain-containing protein [Paucibacter sp. TC2R-5]MCV2358368.1 CHAD domain-containing protein [Paucibacter sp. TC2R-5]
MPSPLKPSKARPVKLRAGLTLEQGFALIARNCLRQVRANEAGLRLSEEPEFVHQLRVGLRRLRSALALFKPWITLPPALADEIAWLGLTLGAARDAEVLAGTTLPAVLLGSAGQEELDGLQKAAASLAQRCRRKAIQAVSSERYLKLMANLGSWLKAKRWREDSACPDGLAAALDTAAKRMLKQGDKKLRQRLQSLQDQTTAENRHRLRIAVKKLRYASEFFSAIAGAKVDARLNQLSALQDLLGQLNDAEVGRQQLLDMGRAHPGPAAFARGVLWAQSQQQIENLAPLLQALGPKRPGS